MLHVLVDKVTWKLSFIAIGIHLIAINLPSLMVPCVLPYSQEIKRAYA